MIPVVWFKGQRGSWDHGIFLQTFEKYPQLFPQYNEQVNPSFDRAIVMCVGKPDVKELKDYLLKIPNGVVIFASEEDAYYPWKQVMHDGLEAWTQYWRPQTKGEIKQENRILLGAPYRIKDHNTSPMEKKYLWSFIGQCQNPFRHAAVEAMKKMKDGYLQVISGFGGYCEDGVEYQKYLDIMRQSKFVICPAGSMSVDSFRLYESMECGAIPITDFRSPRDPQGFNYWDEIFPQNGITLIDGWDAGALTDIMGSVRPIYGRCKDEDGEVYEGLQQNFWWWVYKRELELQLLKLAE